jgi:hypothetical protein
MTDEERAALEEAKKLALMHAKANTKSNFMVCDSKYGNLIIPILPRPEPDSDELSKQDSTKH